MKREFRPHPGKILLSIWITTLTLVLAAPLACRAACPATSSLGWEVNANIDYTTSSFTSAQSSSIGTALGNWTAHNQGVSTGSSNCSQVTFSAGSSTQYFISAQSGQSSLGPNVVGDFEITIVATDGTNAEATTNFYFGAVLPGTTTPAWNPSASNYQKFVQKVMLHEAGHSMGLADIPVASQAAGQSVMNNPVGANDSSNNAPTTVQQCDDTAVESITQYSQNCISAGGGCPYEGQECGVCLTYDNRCNCDVQSCDSPIVVDVAGTGFSLTNQANGVYFDLDDTGTPMLTAWTAPGSANAFLCLDRNGNGTIDNGAELFGNFTPQPPSNAPNGFLALAVYDLPQNGGNGDGIIDSRDAIYSKLLLWQDVNHDGISQPSELHSLSELGVAAISLDYHLSWRQDQFGNKFRYTSAIFDEYGAQDGRWIYDVFFNDSQQ
jgi:hypothetical protein